MPIDARPYPYELLAKPPALVIIDMQRDFVEPGGFGDALGNDVARLQTCIPVIARLLATARHLGLPVIHTREAHRPDLSDCPPSKRLRGDCRLRIGDAGPMGRLLIDGGRVENWRAHLRLRWVPHRFRDGPQSGCHDHVSSSRHVKRSMRISRTTLSCLLRTKGYETYHAGAAFGPGGRQTR